MRTRSSRTLVAIGALFAIVGAGLAAPTSALGAAAPSAGLIADYGFSQTTGATVINQATGPGAVGNATVQRPLDSQWTGNSLTFLGGAKTSTTANWVRLPDGILAGKNSATITTEVAIDATMKSTFNFLWNIGNDATTSYYFVSTRDNARTAITTASNGGEANAQGATALVAGRWYSLTSVIDGDAGTISFYIDGVLAASRATTLKPSSITAQTLNAIGRSPWPDSFFKGQVSTFRVYDRALSASEITAVSDTDAALHPSSFTASAQAILDAVGPVTITDSVQSLSNEPAVTWTSADTRLSVTANGQSVVAERPAAGESSYTTILTAKATVRGQSVSKSVSVTVNPAPAATEAYGYLMVHFIEDSAGYAEKIYLDISKGDDPQNWQALNSGKPILASQLGTTGVRDPYLTYNPETKTYYIIATDLRVFGGDNAGWGAWQKNYSTKMNVWESKDLVTWSDVRQFDVALNTAGVKQAQLGMMWAPEATWVPDYYSEGHGAFVVYWSSIKYPDSDTTQSTTNYSDVLWGATTDFTQATYQYGGVYIHDTGANIDTTMIQDGTTTYRLTKDNGDSATGIYMQSTTAHKWWLPSATWTTVQTAVGNVWASASGVEGPAMYKDNHSNTWYAYVDVIPSTGYRPMVSTNLATGFAKYTGDFQLTPSTKHGGIINLTAGQYDTIRAADATTAVSTNLGTVTVPNGSSAAVITAALPDASVNLANDRGTSELPVDWNLASVDTTTAGDYAVSGVVRSLGANTNQWVGAGGSTAYNASGRTLYSSTAITVNATVSVDEKPSLTALPTPTISGTAKVGSQLTVSAGSWEPAPVALSYQWSRNGSPISGATGTGYTLTAADAGAAISVTVSGAKDGYLSAVRTSEATAAVATGELVASVPTISGAPAVGSVLTAMAGAWGPDPVALGYQWLRNGAAIAGATAASYTVTSSDAGTAIAVTVTGMKPGYAPLSSTSIAAAVPAPVVTVPQVESTVKLSVSPSKPKITSKKGVKVTVTVKVLAAGKPGTATGTAKIVIAGKSHTVKVSKGTAKYTLTIKKAKKYKVTAKYLGTPTVAASATKSTTISVTKK